MLGNLISACDTQINASFPYYGRYLRCRKEYKGNGMVFYERNVEAWGAAKLDVGAGEEVEGGLLETTLCAWS